MRLLITALLGLQFFHPARGRVPQPPPGAEPNCPGLLDLAGEDFVVTAARTVDRAGLVPQHCRVAGRIGVRVRFELYLPQSWNGRLYMHGNGGYAGRFPRAPGYRDRRLREGFAVVWTDTGHDEKIEPLTSFAVDRDKLLDFAHRAVRLTARTAKQLVEIYYSRPHEKAYFEGCSTGGRQGLILAQRDPDEFDGIIVGAPILNETGQRMSQAWIAQALARGPFPPEKLPLLASLIYERCDEIDGLEDGLIDDPRRCDFQPSRDLPVCEGTGNGARCFAPQQVATLEKIYSDVVGGSGRIYPGLPVGAEARDLWRSGWEDWVLSHRGTTTAVRFAESFFRHMAFADPDPTFEISRFDFEHDPARLHEIAAILNATAPDLSEFRERGGRILMFFGWADTAVNPLSGVEYYQEVTRLMGPATSDFFRLFMAPGMFHCVGGLGPSRFDMLPPLMKWVEQQTAPESILASQVDDQGVTLRTRPLCPFPLVARYTGHGNVDDGGNFNCIAPPPSTEHHTEGRGEPH